MGEILWRFWSSFKGIKLFISLFFGDFKNTFTSNLVCVPSSYFRAEKKPPSLRSGVLILGFFVFSKQRGTKVLEKRLKGKGLWGALRSGQRFIYFTTGGIFSWALFYIVVSLPWIVYVIPNFKIFLSLA